MRARFGGRKLQNPLHTAEFGFSTADEAEPAEEMETEIGLGAMSLKDGEGNDVKVKDEKKKSSSGAAGKFQKKDKKKKKSKKMNF